MFSTFTGREVDPHNRTGPSLTDIAVSLGRHPRFGGMGKAYHWTVLHHSLAAQRLAVACGYGHKTRLLALLHDAHEAITGDIPTDWKTPDIREHQDSIDDRIFEEIGVEFTHLEYDRVKLIDWTLLHAEGHAVGPSNWAKVYPGVPVVLAATCIVENLLREYPTPAETFGVWSEAVGEFVTMVRYLRSKVS